MNTNTRKAAIIAALLLLSVWKFGAIVALFIIGVLITLHEFGHWLIARRFGIEVPIFAVGFGRRDHARVIGRLWGTEFQIRPFPLGGFISPEPRSYETASIGARAATLAAGPLTNLLIPLVLFFFLFAFNGVPRVDGIKDVFVSSLSDTVAIAGQSGIESGDIVLALNGAAIERPEQIINGLADSKLKPVTLTLDHAGEKKNVDVVPNSDGKIGIQLAYHVHRSVEQVGPLDAAFYALSETTGMVKSTISMYGDLLTGKNLNQLSSIVGIVAQGSKQISYGWINAVYFMAMLSIALAILNALPLPGLDGGQLLLLAVEKYRGKPVSAVTQGKLTAAVIVFLIALSFYALYNDFVWLLGSFWAVPATVFTFCLAFYLLLPILNAYRVRRSQPPGKP